MDAINNSSRTWTCVPITDTFQIIDMLLAIAKTWLCTCQRFDCCQPLLL